MKITFKLFASLTKYLSAGVRYTHMLELEVAPDACISQIIAPTALPKKIGHHVLLNGNYVEPADRMACTRVEGDALAIWPMIARG